MQRYGVLAVVIAVSLGLCAFCPTAVQGQVIVYSPPFSPIIPVMGPPVVPRVYVPFAPVPTVSYYQPAPRVVYSVPRVSYYQPVTVYSAPIVAPSNVVVTRSFRGFGVFRPRGIYRSTYVQPAVTYSPGYRSSYYRAVIVP